jgi:hypothetical protein
VSFESLSATDMTMAMTMALRRRRMLTAAPFWTIGSQKSRAEDVFTFCFHGLLASASLYNVDLIQ